MAETVLRHDVTAVAAADRSTADQGQKFLVQSGMMRDWQPLRHGNWPNHATWPSSNLLDCPFSTICAPSRRPYSPIILPAHRRDASKQPFDRFKPLELGISYHVRVINFPRVSPADAQGAQSSNAPNEITRRDALKQPFDRSRPLELGISYHVNVPPIERPYLRRYSRLSFLLATCVCSESC